jgi:type III pantothenate kinase
MQPVSLCIDFGNTNLKATIFHGDRLSQKFIFSESDAINTLQKIISIHNPQKAILSSVINHSKSIDNFLQENTKLIVLNSGTKLPFLNAYGTPETLGNDRLALVAALSKQFPAQDSLVVSIGAISPGVELRLRSLHEFTDKLPLVSREGHISILGYDTETSIRSGVINGMVAEIEGMIQFYEGQYGKINAVLTGGDAPFFESRMKKKIFADTNFLFKGLYAILEQQK